ncbi:SDR family NAD(P)-dependent oxidoreductase [Acinetobacter chinensis]|uniref:SDR family NAD(P)-dependent oxidoreductase n=1 Tax=Acinetobacter chinensis TaxID=2004650 RepID=A0ABU3WAR4_9GAMM|nr:SDR family NAD(P)-dependent oxidoreductase [Acinetobacter chinensis]MDV2467484.1 SDR family NAD(P)-dependent oxidoreductase [Acinetobacter chinensis]
MTMKNKVAMITGAASGIGRAVAEQLAAQQCQLCLVDQNADALEALAETLGKQVKVITSTGDLSQADFVENVVAQVEQQFGRLDYALNNAGVTSPAQPLHELTLETWNSVLGVNLNSVFYGLKAQIPLMLKSGGGSVVNTSSMLGLVATQNRAAYVTSKHAVTGLSKAAALDYAQQNIRVNSVHPGYIETPLISHIDQQMLIQKHPIGRLGTPQEVAELICFLLSEQASFITGAQYVIDGGYTIQ